MIQPTCTDTIPVLWRETTPLLSSHNTPAISVHTSSFSSGLVSPPFGPAARSLLPLRLTCLSTSPGTNSPKSFIPVPIGPGLIFIRHLEPSGFPTFASLAAPSPVPQYSSRDIQCHGHCSDKLVGIQSQLQPPASLYSSQSTWTIRTAAPREAHCQRAAFCRNTKDGSTAHQSCRNSKCSWANRWTAHTFNALNVEDVGVVDTARSKRTSKSKSDAFWSVSTGRHIPTNIATVRASSCGIIPAYSEATDCNTFERNSLSGLSLFRPTSFSRQKGKSPGTVRRRQAFRLALVAHFGARESSWHLSTLHNILLFGDALRNLNPPPRTKHTLCSSHAYSPTIARHALESQLSNIRHLAQDHSATCPPLIFGTQHDCRLHLIQQRLEQAVTRPIDPGPTAHPVSGIT